MLNWRLISKIMGILLFIEVGLMAMCQVVAWIYDEGIEEFVLPMIIAYALGSLGVWVGRGAGNNMGRKEGYVVVSMTWLLFTVIGMLPFLMEGALPDVASAFFESMSGFTSTGATIIDDIDSMPRCLLFWRSLSQWIGGVGIVFFTIAILPAFGVGEVKLFAAESTGPMHDKVHPRISMAVKWIGSVYLFLTFHCFISLLLCGVETFDALNYAMCTVATGGYGTHSDLLHDVWDSAAVEYVLIYFMFVAGVNYTLIYYSILKGRIVSAFRDAELRCYVILSGAASLVCTLVLTIVRAPSAIECGEGIWGILSTIELAFRESAFTVISLMTTTGLATCDYTLWPVQLMPILLFVMFAGACSGSSCGGFKCVRWSIIFRIVRGEFNHILHPRAVIPVRLNGNVIPQGVLQTLSGFVALFVGALFVGAFVLALFGVSPNDVHPDFDYYEAFGLALSSLSNVGPGMGYYGPAHSWMILSPFAKYVCSFLMLIGRLEIFPILIIFTRAFWKKG